MYFNLVGLFQNIYPMFAKSKLRIMLNKKTTEVITIFMNGLNFLDSYWQLLDVNLNMINCHAASLTLELKYSIDVIVENCTFGNWIFTKVQKVFIKNCSNSIDKGSLTSLKFLKSSASMENITIKDLNLSSNFNGLIVQDSSYLKILKSKFLNNIVDYRIITVLNSSTLIMIECKMQNNSAQESAGAVLTQITSAHFTNFHLNYKNWALEAKTVSRKPSSWKQNSKFTNIKATASTIEYGGAIYSHNSTLDISNSLFCHNKVNGSGTFVSELSKATVNNCTFFKNSNTAVVLIESTEASIMNCIFQSNSCPYYGGAILVNNSCELSVLHSTFLNNSAAFGGAISVHRYSVLMITESSFFENSAILENWDVYKNISGEGGALYISNSKMNTFQSQFYRNYAYVSGGSVAAGESSLMIHNTMFENNIAGYNGGAISTAVYCSTIIEDSLFTNNSAQNKAVAHGGSLYVHLGSTVNISRVNLFQNEAQFGGAIFAADFSQIILSNSSLEGNKGSAIYSVNNISLQINDSWLYNNSAPKGGAVFVESYSMLNVTNTVFKYNNAITSGGAVHVNLISAVSLYNCSFTGNSAFQGGAVVTSSSDIKIFTSNFTENKAVNGGVFLIAANLFIVLCIMDNNTATGNGGVAYIEENSQVNITTGTFMGNSALGSGGVFCIRNSTTNVWNSFFADNSVGVNGGVIDTDDISMINMSQTTCFGNKVKGGKGGVLNAGMNTKIFLHDVKLLQNYAPSCGTMLLDASTLKMTQSQVHENNALVNGGALCIFNNSSFIAISSSFKGNSTFHAGAIIFWSGTAYLENCTLVGNQGTNGGAITFASNELRISDTVFSENMAQIGADLSYESNVTLKIYRCQFNHGNMNLHSNISKFKQIAIREGFIGDSGFVPSILEIKETQYAASKKLRLTIS